MPFRKRSISSKAHSRSGIVKFAQITKPHVPTTFVKSQLNPEEGFSGPILSPVEVTINRPTPLKRKAETFVNDIQCEDSVQGILKSKRKRSQVSKHNDPSSPSATRPPLEQDIISILPTPEATPVAGRFVQDTELVPRTPSHSITSGIVSCDTPPSTPQILFTGVSPIVKEDGLPEDLNSLVGLHAAFLKALSLHYAHHGPSSPIDIRTILPSISRIWGERAVTLEDVRRSLGILGSKLSTSNPSSERRRALFRLSDYGRGKICIERDGLELGQIDETEWNRPFLDTLQQRWHDQKQITKSVGEVTDMISTVMAQLPLAKIEKCSALEKVKPMFAEGQRRLEDLKVGAIKAQSKPFKETQAKTKWSGVEIKSRNEELLSRLKAKELLQTTIKLETTVEMARKAALQRIEEIVMVICTFSLAKASTKDNSQRSRRQSHSLPLLIDSIRHSVRRPISKEETERCLRLLADEIARGFLTFVMIGRVTCVVIDHGMKPNDLDKRITAALQ